MVERRGDHHPRREPRRIVRSDLQAVFNRTYDAGPFRKRIRYVSEEMTPPLSDTDAAWVRECVRVWTDQ